MKRIVSLLLVIVICYTILPQTALAATSFTTPSNVSVTEAYNKIYDLFNALGDGSYFTVTNTASCGAKSSGHSCKNCRLKTILNQSWFKNKFGELSTSQFPITYIPGGEESPPDGWSCYGFATFAEWYIYSSLKTDKVTTKYVGTFNYDYDGVSSNVRVGDLIRLNNSHSAIVISYDKTGVKVLDCNGSGSYNCQVHIRTIEYSRYSTYTISRAKNSVDCVHDHTNSGYCKYCGNEYDYLSSLDTNEAGYYKVTTSGGITLRTGPYQARSTTGSKIAYGTQLRVTGSVKNHFINKWYQIEINGTIGYTHESHLTLVKRLEQNITGTITDPVMGERIPQGKHPVSGTITSHNYHLEEVKAYLDGRCYATVTLENTNTLDVRSSDINAKLSFGSLSLGEHTLLIKARDKYHSTFSPVCSVTFTTICGTHSYTSVVTNPATCVTAGVRTYTCSKCGNSYTEAIPATGNHSYGGWITVTAASCTTNGVQHNSCTVCGITQTQSIAATGHSYGQWSTLTPGNCTTGEIQKTYCVYCGAMETQILPAVGHSYGGWTTIEEATCTTNGTQQKVCFACGDTQYQAIPAIGYHSYGGWVTVTTPTCTGNGTQQATCAVCGDVQTQTIPAIGHSPSGWWEYNGDAHWMNCVSCGHTLEMGSHQYIDYTCEVCGYLRAIPGDLDGDKDVDNQDVAYLLWYTLFPDDYPIAGDVDFNGDGTINNADVAYLLWHTLFPEDYPL